MREVITVRDCGVPSKGAPHVVQYGDTQKELMSLLRQGYQLTYYLENPPEQGKLTVSQPNREDNSGCIGCAHLDLRLDMTSDQIPADLADYYNILFPPGIVDRPNTNPLPYYSAEVKDILQNILSVYTALLREEELNPPETTPSNTPDQVTTNPAQIIASPTNDNTPYTPGSITFNTDTFISEISPTNTTIVVLQEIDWEKLKNILQLTTTTPEMLTTTPETLTDTTETDTTVSQAPADNDTVRNIEPGLYGPGNVTFHIDPEYAKQMEEQFKNVKMRVGGCGRGQAFFRFIYDSDDAETPSGYELVRTESWSGPDCTDEQIADIARYIINNDISDEQQKALMLEAVDAFLAKEEKITVADGTPNYTPKVVFVDSEPLRMIPATDTPIAFISTVDAETEAVTSVQVACADTDGWRTIGTLNPDGIDWKYKAGNLTGSGAPSVVWHAQELGALGVWTDGTDNWTGIEGWFDANWTMLGCGDFDDDGKDSVLMSLYGGLFYSVDLDGTLTSLGGLNWSGWEFGAVGDFAGDGKDDVVLYHKELGSVVLLADGKSDAWTSLGQIDGSDWAVAGAGDFNGDGIADLLVRQASTGLIGGYAGADMSKWSVVDSDAGYYLA